MSREISGLVLQEKVFKSCFSLFVKEKFAFSLWNKLRSAVCMLHSKMHSMDGHLKKLHVLLDKVKIW